MGTRIFVGNLSFNTNDADLRSHFEAAGFQVNEVTIVNDRETGRSRGFGFVEMSSDDDAQAAMNALDGQELDGRALRINEAQERQRGGGGGGGGRGGRGGGGGGYGGGGGGGGRGGGGGGRGGRGGGGGGYGGGGGGRY
ncbi:MAG: RNA recognition motif domain-containing protein [Planctomycetota bacterium]|jgi:RNA recognition motif-containing protein